MRSNYIVPSQTSPETILSANVTSNISFRAVVVTVYCMWKTYTRTQTPAWRSSKGPLSRCVDAEMGETDIPDILKPNFQEPKLKAPISENLEMDQELMFHPDYCLDNGVSWSDVVGDMAGVEAEVALEYQLCEEEEGVEADVTVWGLEVIEEGEEEEE